MNCQEAMNLWSSYQDGELDATFREEIRRHLEACAECRRFFEAQGAFDTALTQVLKQSPPTDSLWQQQTAALRSAFRPSEPEPAARSFWAGLWWPSPGFYGALAALWLVLLAANQWADYGNATQTRKQSLEQRAMLAEQRRELRALRMALDTDPSRSEPLPPGPRTEWQPDPASIPTTGLRHTQASPQLS